jgi:cytochrome b6-f complex iron-sulfur subunit
MKRKDFLRSAGIICGAGLVGGMAFLESCKKSSNSSAAQGPTVNFTLDLTQPANSALNNVGGSVALQGVVVAHTSGGFVAVAQACTHQGCNISYNNSATNFVCPCHGATFSTTGAAISGPTSTPVKKYTITQSGNILTIAG